MPKKTRTRQRVKSSEWTTLELNPVRTSAQIGAVKVAEGVTAVTFTSDDEQWRRAREIGSNVEFKKRRSPRRNQTTELDSMIGRFMSQSNSDN